jgi:hypothetical protein
MLPNKKLKNIFILNLFIKFLPIALFFFFIIFPILNLSHDMWDGTILEYAKLKEDYTGIKILFYETNLYLGYYFTIIIIYFSDLLSLSFKDSNAFFLLIFGFFFIRENCILAERQIKLRKFFIFFVGCLSATFPAWENLLTTSVSFQFFCITLGLFSIRIIHNNSKLLKLLGFFFLVFSYTLQSLLVFLPILSLMYDLLKKNSNFKYPSAETILIFLIAILFFLIFNVFYPPSGLYVGYNDLNIKNISDLFLLIYHTLRSSTYLLPLFLIIFVISIFIRTVSKNKLKFNTKNRTKRHILKCLIVLFLLFFAGAFPYAAVLKSSILWQVDGWSGRHAFLLAVPTSLLSALCLEILYYNILRRSKKFIIILGAAIVLLINFGVLMSGVFYNSNRQIFLLKLEYIIKTNINSIKPGLLQIIGNGIPGPVLASYEINYLMYKITGKTDWWSRVGEKEDKEFTIPDFLQNNSKYHAYYVYNFHSSHLKNHTIINIQVENFKGILNFFKNYFGINSQNKIKVISVLKKNNLN